MYSSPKQFIKSLFSPSLLSPRVFYTQHKWVTTTIILLYLYTTGYISHGRTLYSRPILFLFYIRPAEVLKIYIYKYIGNNIAVDVFFFFMIAHRVDVVVKFLCCVNEITRFRAGLKQRSSFYYYKPWANSYA